MIIIALVKHTIKSCLARKSFYVFLGIGLLIVLLSIPSFMAFSAAIGGSSAQDPSTIIARRGSLIGQLLSLWESIIVLGGIFFGALHYRNEIQLRTILAIIAKPTSRLQFFVSRFIGIFLFLSFFLFLGYILAFSALLYFGITPGSLILFGFIYGFIKLFLFTGIAFSLGHILHSVFAGGITFIVYILPAFLTNFMEMANPIISTFSRFLYFLCPAQMYVNIIEETIHDQLVDPNIWLIIGVMAENIFYGLVVMLVGYISFNSKDILFQ